MAKELHTILALDTATKICSVALRTPDHNIIERREKGIGIHSELLFVFIEEVLNEAKLTIDDLDAVLVTSGPGSYTGLRIAASAVKGLLFNRSIPLFGVNTLVYFAASAFKKHPDLKRVHAVIDARRVHLYHQLFENGTEGIKPLTDVTIREIDALSDSIETADGIIGTGIHRIPVDVLKNVKVIEDEWIQASSLIDLFDRYKNEESKKSVYKLIEEVKPEDFNPHYYNKSHPQVSKM